MKWLITYEKTDKYSDIARELKKKLRDMKVTVTPIVIFIIKGFRNIVFIFIVIFHNDAFCRAGHMA